VYKLYDAAEEGVRKYLTCISMRLVYVYAGNLLHNGDITATIWKVYASLTEGT
jgi:hypothetical protein